MARDLLAPIPFREVFVILALFLPQLSFVDEASARRDLWSSPTVRKHGLVVDITPTAAGLQGMHEYRIAFPAGSQAATFCPAHLQSQDFGQLATNSSNAVHMGCQVGKAYRLVLLENDACYSVLALLLAFVTPSRRKKGEESLRDKLRRMSSPRYWDVALVPFPADFAPPPATAETGLACPVKCEFPPSLLILESRATKFRVLAFAEAGDTVTADHLLQMATLAAEHKPTVLGIPGHVPIPYNLERAIAMLQSLHALFQLLTTGGTLMYCPQASDFAKALGTAARHDNGHIVSLAASLALALRSGRSTLAVAGVFGAGKTRSLTFLLEWLALTTRLKIAVVHKENPAGRAITKLLTAFALKPDHQRYFIRPVSREEAEANTASTSYDLRASEAAPYIRGCRVVIVTTRGLCRCTATATCQHRVRHQVRWCRCVAKLQAAPHCQITDHWAFQIMCFATANCSTVFLPLVAGSLATKPLRSAARYNGYVQQKELPIGLATTPSLGTISFKGVSTWLSLPCKSSTP